jgi:hypothetical protein
LANYSTHILDVLANSPAEINQIAERLKRPSSNIVGQSAFAVIQDIVQFEPVDNLGYVDASVNKARRFKNDNSQWRTGDLIDGHMFEVSAEFSDAIFLLEEQEDMGNYAGKYVIRAGKVFVSTLDDEPKSQMYNWVLLDIFSPFRNEYENGQPFGSLWKDWVPAMYKALQSLPCSSRATGHMGAPCVVCGSMALYETVIEQRVAEALDKQREAMRNSATMLTAEYHDSR